MLFKDTNLQLVGKFWRPNAQHGDLNQQFYIINIKVAEKVGLVLTTKKEMITMLPDRGVS